MAKLNKKAVEKVFEDFKDCHFIDEALELSSIRPYDFFDYLKKNTDAAKEYEEIERFNNIYKEAQIERKVYTGDFSKQILLEMIKARDKKKYAQKFEFEDKTQISSLSDEELNRKIAEAQARCLGK